MDIISWIIFLSMCMLMHSAFTATVERVYIRDSQPSIKGTNIQLICEIKQFSYQELVGIYKTDTRALSGTLPTVLTFCLPSVCLTTVAGRYTFSSDSQHVYINITNLNRSEDQKWWTFVTGSQRKDIALTILSVPQTLQFVSSPSQDQDLAANSVTLRCSTGCVYPQPDFTWYYTESGELFQEWTTSGYVSVSSQTGTCTDSEKIYTSTLYLAKYTIFTGNIQKNIRFKCGITSFIGLTQPLYTEPSVNVQFAVQVTNATLMEGNSVPSGQLRVTKDVFKTLVCTTSVSRPTATVVWYIGTEEKQRSNSSTIFTYTPQNSDHNKQIYCKAFNTQPESRAVSSNNATLYVLVPVISVTLKDGNGIPSDLLQVTSGVSKTLTCTTSFSRPTATVVLYIGIEQKQRSNSSTIFRFTPQNTDHDKHIYCKAFNVNSSRDVTSDKSTLYVQVLARTPTLTNKTTGSLVLLENDTVSMECFSSPTRPVAIVTWRKESAILTNVYDTNITVNAGLVSVRSIVTFTPRRSDDSKHVYCETAIPEQQNNPTSQQRITVYWPPSVPVIPVTDLPFLEDQTGRALLCLSTDYGNPDSGALWDSANGIPDSSNSRILKLPRLTPEMDKNQVSCQLGNNFTQAKGLQLKSATISLDVEYTPRIQILEHGNVVHTVTRNEGQVLNVSCHADGNPLPTVRWEGQTPVSSELKFIDIDRTNHGIYTCRAEASSSKYSAYDFVTVKNVSVVVYYAPEVNVTFSNTQPVENVPLLIICNVVGRSHSPISKSMKQTWDSLTIPNSHSISDGIFKIEKLQLQDSGTYICIANNGIPDRSQRINQTGKRELKIKVSPKVLLQGSHIFAGAPGKSVHLSVPFYSYPGIQSVMFKFPNGSEIVNSVKYDVSFGRSKVTTTFYGQKVELEGYNATLRIRDEEETDFVNYTLVLDNGIGQPMEWTLFHVSESLPLRPKLFVFTGILKGVPTFLLIGNYNGGRKQTFSIESRIVGKEGWTEKLRFSETDREFLKKETLTFRFNVTGLSPNTYEVRVLAENELGSIKYDEAPKVTFIIEDIPTPSTIKCDSPVITGTTLGIVCVALAVYAVTATILWRRRTTVKGKQTPDKQMTYVNLNFEQGIMDNSVSRYDYAETRIESSEGHTEPQYTSLSLIPDDKTTPYEELQSVGTKTRKT